MSSVQREGHRIPLLVLGALLLLTLLIEGSVIAFPLYAGTSYQGINIAPFGNDEHHYLTRGKEVLEGHGVGQPYLAEWKDKPDSFQSHAEQFLMTPLRLLGLEDINVVTAYNILNGVGVFLMLVLLYLFVFELSGDVLLSAAAAIFAIGGYVLVQNGTVLMWLVRGNSLVFGAPNIFGRSTDPYTALVPFFGFLILTCRAALARFLPLSPETWKPYAYVLGGGALFGVLFYDYFYAWTFALAFLGSLCITSLLWKRWHAAVASVAVGAVGIVLAIPMLTGFFRLFTSPLGNTIAFFFMATHSRALIGSVTGIATVALFALYAYVRRDDRNNFILLAIIAAGWIALEQQVITGRAVQYGHYYWYFIVPLSVVISVYMLVRLIPEKHRAWRRGLCIALVAVAFLNTAGQQYKSFFVDLPWKMREQDFAPVIAALQKDPEGVVLTDPGGESYPFLVTIFTDHDLYWLPAAITSAVPIEHPREALLVYLFLDRDSRADPVAYLRSALASTTPNAYTELYEELEAYDAQIPMQEYWRTAFPHTSPAIMSARARYLPQVGTEYKARANSREKVRSILKARDVRYILWDVRQNPEWDLTALGPMTLIATSTDIKLYELTPLPSTSQ